MSGVEARKIENKQDFKAFFEFPWVLYKDDPNWVPPLLSMRKDQLSKEKNPAWQYMEGDYFGAWRGDKIVGTIAAYINHRHNEFQQEHIGWFGAFEVYDDQEAATALLNTAADWVQGQGYDAIRGPQTFTTHEETGLLVENFDRPVLLMPYNKPYYQRLVETAGFEKNMNLYSVYINKQAIRDAGVDTRLKRITQGIMKRGNIRVRPIDRKNLKSEFKLFKELYNAAWDKNWGFVPMTEQELDALVASLGQFFDPNYAFFAHVHDEPAGFIMAIPDFNEVLKAAAPRPGVPEVVSLLRALWFWKIRPVITWIRVPLMGVKEAYRKIGVDAALYYHVLEQILISPYEHSESGWLLETNEDILRIAETLGGTRYKTHRYYQKTFKP